MYFLLIKVGIFYSRHYKPLLGLLKKIQMTFYELGNLLEAWKIPFTPFTKPSCVE
jgi:hypothetical protein